MLGRGQAEGTGMCGRFAMALDPERLRRFYGLVETPRVQPRYNITPASPVGVVRPRGPHDARRVWRELLWGLVPFWAKQPRLGRMINARAETVASKPAFRAAFRYRRCVLPASGFYEWRRPPGGGPKQPYYFTAANDEPLSMAGLWERWQGEDGS
ncbi:MAG: SOS response-associated peptidase, partial [Planctomycetota bacterium]